MSNFESLLSRWKWTPIPQCPGRYKLAGPWSTCEPSEFIGLVAELRSFEVSTAKDLVVVALLADGSGLISYRKPNGLYLHTLNTPEGLLRKLASLGKYPITTLQQCK